MKNKKWFIENNTMKWNSDTINVLPIIKVWYNKRYPLETGVHSPAFGLTLSWCKWNYYLTIQSGY